MLSIQACVRLLSRACLFLGLMCVPGMLQGQIVVIESVRVIRPIPPVPTPPVVPTPPPLPTPTPSSYKVRSVDVQASVRDQAAKVQLSQIFQNTGSTTLQAQLIFPIPENAAIDALTLLVDGKELAGKLMKKDEARRIYEDIVRRQKDPALLEYMGQGLFQTSVFPIPPQAERTVEIRYSQLLRKDNGLIDMVLPLGTSKHSHQPIESLNINVRVESSAPLKTIYSPSHAMEIQRPDDTHAVCRMSLKNVLSPDDLRLLFGLQGGLVGMNVISYKPHENEDGYFVLLASPEVKQDPAARIDKTMVFVFDKSGSMSGKKIEQAKEALKFLVNQLKPGDTFNIVAYDSAVESFRPELQRADEATLKAATGFVDGLYAGGSTNIDGALKTALTMLVEPKRPSYVLFLTDGLPTVGEMNEQKIAANVSQANLAGARLFSFGVGFDVNSRLLDRLSRNERGQSIFVRPNENIETHVAALQAKIGSPLLNQLSVNFEFDKALPAGSAAPISRTYPRQLTDLFQGEQLVYVGRYRQGGTAKVMLSGSVGGEKKSFTFPADFVERSVDESNGFVEKLWATRRIGEIIDELDLKGHNQELIDEMVQLSLRHGIMTPYTSFLADENVSLADRSGNRDRAERSTRELERVDGASGFGQRRYKGELQAANQAGGGAGFGARAAAEAGGPSAKNGFAAPAAPSSATPTAGAAKPADSRKVDVKFQAVLAEEGETKEQETVRNVGQKTFYLKKKQWQDSTVTPEQAQKAIRIKQFSKEYFELAATAGGKLARYLVFDEPVVLNLGDKTYQIDPPDPE